MSKNTARSLNVTVKPCPLTASDIQKTQHQIALSAKEAAHWRCQHCQRLCLRPGEKPSTLTRSEWTHTTLSVHHSNFTPEDNTTENLIALCTPCHLAVHGRTKRSNVSPGQLSLWDIAPNVFGKV